MSRVELRDIRTDADWDAVMGLRLGPGQDEHLNSMPGIREESIEEARGMPHPWAVHDADTGELVGFVMISDNIPEPVPDDMVGPYFLWKLIVDAEHQRGGYGTAIIDAVVDYLRDRPGADVLYVSAGQGEGSPQPFYERYGFVPTGEIKWDEVVLRLDLPKTTEDR